MYLPPDKTFLPSNQLTKHNEVAIPDCYFRHDHQQWFCLVFHNLRVTQFLKSNDRPISLSTVLIVRLGWYKQRGMVVGMFICLLGPGGTFFRSAWTYSATFCPKKFSLNAIRNLYAWAKLIEEYTNNPLKISLCHRKKLTEMALRSPIPGLSNL